MTVSAVLILGIVFVILLRVYVARRRRTIRKDLLRSGTRVTGRVITIAGRGDSSSTRSSGIIIVSYTTSDGVARQAYKLPQRASEAWLASEPVSVLYDPAKPADSERVLLGFGRTEKRWFRARIKPLRK